jgi:hypothetical protein
MELIEKIKDNPSYKKILADSFGGVMYNVANRGKYDTIDILRIWGLMTSNEKEMS